MKVIIAGSRDFKNYDMLKSTCDHLLMKVKSDITIISGAAKGADKLGERYAAERGYIISSHPADWDKYGLSAGYRRNVDMADEGDCLIAFWDGKSKGTKHMIDIAIDKELNVIIVGFKNK